MTVSEVSALTGLSVRTLHYYDEIGLLKPESVGENSYRFYGEKSLARLQEIMFLRELDFPLKEISAVLLDPKYDKAKALSNQRELLLLKKRRLEKLIGVIDGAMKGESAMKDFKAFENTDYEAAREKYADEVKARWGDTDAYRESKGKTFSADAGKASDEIMKAFAELKKSGAEPDCDGAQQLVKQWQAFITKNFYSCTAEILAGLGQMYTADERFTANIDRFGEGTAEFMSGAIAFFCEKQS